ncbi:MAG TPA: HAD family phosphatase [Myxococcaceae bacterium]|nr:HAD family phosphatase [Myxococcaceae bacterium]
MQAVILDLGNVLVFHDNARLFRALGERAGLEGPEVERRLSGASWDAANRGEMTREEIWRTACRALGLELAAADFNDLWCCHFAVNDAVMPVVASLVGKVGLLLLSNSNPIHVEHVRPRVPLLAKFDHVLFSCEVGMAKPDPRFYREALRRAGTAPGQTAYFDDHAPFLEPAREMGIQARQFTSVEGFRKDLEAMGLGAG